MRAELPKVSKKVLAEVHNEVISIDKRCIALEKELAPITNNLLNKIAKQFISVFDVNTTRNAQDIYDFVDNYKPDLISLYRTGYSMSSDEFGYDIRKKLLSKKQQSNTIKKALEYEIDDKSVAEIDKRYYNEWLLFENNQSEVEVAFVLQSLVNDIERAIQKSKSENNLYIEGLDNSIADLLQKINNIQNNIVVYSNASIKLKEYEDKLTRLQERRQEDVNNAEVLILANFTNNIAQAFKTHAKLITDSIINTAEAKARNLEYNSIKSQEGGLKKNAEEVLFSELFTNVFWASVGDSKVRISHSVANGQIKINGTYTVGGYLCSYPRDPRLPIQERARCRCREVFTLF